MWPITMGLDRWKKVSTIIRPSYILRPRACYITDEVFTVAAIKLETRGRDKKTPGIATEMITILDGTLTSGKFPRWSEWESHPCSVLDQCDQCGRMQHPTDLVAIYGRGRGPGAKPSIICKHCADDRKCIDGIAQITKEITKCLKNQQ